MGNGQGFLKFGCKSKCATEKCACKQNKVPCSSKCHRKAYVCNNKIANIKHINKNK